MSRNLTYDDIVVFFKSILLTKLSFYDKIMHNVNMSSIVIRIHNN